MGCVSYALNRPKKREGWGGASLPLPFLGKTLFEMKCPP
jgi:hypothetical protein